VTDEREIWVAENQRLKQDVKELHARVEAIEGSRWWRLHPRFLVARLVRRSSEPPAADTAPMRVVERPASDVADRFQRAVVARGEFSEDWFTVYIPTWDEVLRELEGKRARVLEVGSFEGLSACFVLWRLPDAQLTCVDTFDGIPAYQAYGIGGPDLERRFDRNIALVDASRLRKRTGRSHRMLSDLLAEGEGFDLVYIDASHRALDVLADAALCWQLVAPGGLVIFDDYGSIPAGVEPLEHPTLAVDAFRALVAQELEVVDQQRQLIVRKTG
jgi:Methyltransferase domain